MKAFLKIGIDQFLVSLSLFVFSSIAVSITSFEEYARYSNMLAVLVFMQGLIQATLGEQLIYGWRTANYINLTIVLVTLMVGVIIYVDLSKARGAAVMSSIITAAILATFYPATRALFYAYNPKQGSLLSLIFSILLLVLSIIVLIFSVSDPMYLLGVYLVSQVCAILLAIILKGFPIIDYEKFKVVKSLSFKQIAYHMVLFMASGLVFIFAEKIDPELTGRYRKILFFVYPINQGISVITLWLMPMLRTRSDEFIRLARKVTIVNIFCAPLLIVIFYAVYNVILHRIELNLIELVSITAFGTCLIPNVIASHYMKFRHRWRSLIVGHGVITVLFIGGFLYAIKEAPVMAFLIILATTYQFSIAIYNLLVLRK